MTDAEGASGLRLTEEERREREREVATIIMDSLRSSGGINPNTHTVWTDWRPEAKAVLAWHDARILADRLAALRPKDSGLCDEQSVDEPALRAEVEAIEDWTTTAAHPPEPEASGSWVCGRCGQAPESHAAAYSGCVYDPVFRGAPEPEASDQHVEWGVRDDGSGHTATAMSRRTADEWLAFLAADHPNEPATLMRRTRTTYAERVTEWETVDGDV